MNNDRSVIVFDPKGELAAITASYRSTVSHVVMLNPFNVLNLGSAGRADHPAHAHRAGYMGTISRQGRQDA